MPTLVLLIKWKHFWGISIYFTTWNKVFKNIPATLLCSLHGNTLWLFVLSTVLLSEACLGKTNVINLSLRILKLAKHIRAYLDLHRTQFPFLKSKQILDLNGCLYLSYSTQQIGKVLNWGPQNLGENKWNSLSYICIYLLQSGGFGVFCV